MTTAPFDLEDTALARLLHQRGLVPLVDLQQCLAHVRAVRSASTPVTLAGVLVQRGLLSPQQVEETLAGRGSSASALSSSSGHLGTPAQLGPYRLVRELARGGMGAVHEAVHEPTGVRYAVKTIQPAGLSGGLDPDERARFAAEAQLMARLDHVSVARIHAAALDAPVPYLVQDLLSGGSLQERIDRAGVFAPDDAAALTAKLARGLAHAHALGVLHRDLKPNNVLFDERGEPKLVDFGLARALDSEGRLTATGDILGTPGYLSPEQAMGEKGDDPRTDVYGLGGILYAALTGRPPVAPASSLLMTLGRVVAGEVVPPRQVNPDVPSDLNAICLEALATAPEQRYPSAEAFAEALETRTAPPRRPGWLPILAGVAVVGAILVVVGVLARTSTPEQARVEPARARRTSAAAPRPTVSGTAPPPIPTPTQTQTLTKTITWEDAASRVRAILADPDKPAPFTAALNRHKEIEEWLPERARGDPAPDPELARELIGQVRKQALLLRKLGAERLEGYGLRGAQFPLDLLTGAQVRALRHGLLLWSRFSNFAVLPDDLADLLLGLVAADPYIRDFDLALLDLISRRIDQRDAERHRRVVSMALRASRPRDQRLPSILKRCGPAVRPKWPNHAQRLNLLRLALVNLRGQAAGGALLKRVSVNAPGDQRRALALTGLAFLRLNEARQASRKASTPATRRAAFKTQRVARATARRHLSGAQALAKTPRVPLLWILWGRLHLALENRAAARESADAYLALARKQRRGAPPEEHLSIVPALSLHWALATPQDTQPLTDQLYRWHRHLPSKYRLRYAWLCTYRNELETALELVRTALASRRSNETWLKRCAKESGRPARHIYRFPVALERTHRLELLEQALEQGDRRQALSRLARDTDIGPAKIAWLEPK